MGKKVSLEDEINDFISLWDYKAMKNFFIDVIPLYELYDVEENDDWVEKAVGGDAENIRTIRLLRMVYLVSRLSEFHAGRLCNINCKFKNLWKKMEKHGLVHLEDKSDTQP